MGIIILRADLGHLVEGGIDPKGAQTHFLNLIFFNFWKKSYHITNLVCRGRVPAAPPPALPTNAPRTPTPTIWNLESVTV